MTALRPALAVLTLILAACAPAEPVPVPSPLPTAGVAATGETVAVANARDAADDPAIWRNAADPAASLVVGTDKQAGLYVYDLAGKVRHFVDAGRVNNVDLIDTAAGVLVAASDRNDVANGHVALFRLDTAAARLVPLGRVPAGAGEAYGLCLWAPAGEPQAFVVMKDGTIRQLALDLAGPAPAARVLRTLKLATQSEGCVVDPRSRRLYVAEEDVGLWRFDARADGPVQPVKVGAADGRAIVADAEGVAIAFEGRDAGWLVVSSQGDNAYAVWRLPGETYAGRFRIVAGGVGAAEETDGIAIATGAFGPTFPAGLMVAQDGRNAPAAQNFKLVRWDRVKAALGLP